MDSTLYITWEGGRPGAPTSLEFLQGDFHTYWSARDERLPEFCDMLAREIILRQPEVVYMSTVGVNRIIFDTVQDLLWRYGRRGQIELRQLQSQHLSMLGQRTLPEHTLTH